MISVSNSHKHPLDWRFTPVLVTAALIIATLVLWHAVWKQERAQFERVVRLATENIAADIADDVQRPIGDLSRIAELWHSTGGPNKQQFEIHSSFYIGRSPGCVAVAWVSPSSEIWSVSAPEEQDLQRLYLESESARKASQAARNSHSPVISTAVQHHNRSLVSVWTPVYVGNAFHGYIVGLFRVEPLLNTALADSDFGYSVVISDSSGTIYSLHALNTEQQREWAQSAKVALPGISWDVIVWPEDGRRPDSRSLSTIVLLGGLLLACLGAVITYLAQKAHSAAQIAEDTNRELTKEVIARRRAEESLHALSGRLLKVQDEERQSLARILHEGMAQKLFGLSMHLKVVSRMISTQPAEITTKFQQNIDLADDCVCEMRALTHLLHPPSLDVLGLVAACATLADGFKERSGIEVATEFPEDLARLPQDMEMALFRIVQESLTNIHHHSGSVTALVRLTRHDGVLVLEVKDEGRGIAPDTTFDHGIGIAGMRERMWQLGGELQVDSSPRGTTIRALLPYVPLVRDVEDPSENRVVADGAV